MPADQTVSLEVERRASWCSRAARAASRCSRCRPKTSRWCRKRPNFGPVVQRAAEDAEGPARPGVVRHGGARHPLLPERHPVRGRRQAAEPGGHRRPPPGLRVGHARRRGAAPGSDPAAQDRARDAAPAVRRRRRHRDAVRRTTRPSSASAAWSSSPSWSRASSPTTTA